MAPDCSLFPPWNYCSPIYSFSASPLLLGCQLSLSIAIVYLLVLAILSLLLRLLVDLDTRPGSLMELKKILSKRAIREG